MLKMTAQYFEENFSLNWIGLVKPKKYVVMHQKNNIASFKIEPLEKGFGTTLANCIRRILMSSLCGTAVSAVKFDGISHEYSTIDGIREDVIEIIINLKSVSFKGNIGFSSKRFTLPINCLGSITAGMIETDDCITVTQPNYVICNTVKKINLNIDIIVTSGKGYITSNEHRMSIPPGFIFIDSLYTPVKRCFFTIENSRIGPQTEFDKLLLSIETDGSLSPQMALSLAAKILQTQCQVFIILDKVKEVEKPSTEPLPYDINLLRKVSDLELSVRSYNCLKSDNIIYIGDIVTKSEAQMLRTPNFGKKSLSEIRSVLKMMNLDFGMKIKDWPPAEIEEKVGLYLKDK